MLRTQIRRSPTRPGPVAPVAATASCLLPLGAATAGFCLLGLQGYAQTPPPAPATLSL